MRERRQFSWPLNKLALRGGEGHFHLDKVLKAGKKLKKLSQKRSQKNGSTDTLTKIIKSL